ncbi:MAG: ATP-binding protein [Actinomycetota bacterium]|nr:ATP-binding protein [Actinomycetota bacterium]
MRPDPTRAARLQLAPYFLVLALPLAIGVWAFGNYAASNARDRADSELGASLTAAAAAYRGALSTAALEARALTRTPRIQRAILHGDRRKLRRFARTSGHVAFFRRGRLLAGHVFPDAPQRSVVIRRRQRVLGSVVIYVPLDARLLGRMRSAASVERGDRLVALDRGRVVAGFHGRPRLHVRSSAVTDVRVGGDRYRALALDLVRGRDLDLAILGSRSRISAAEWHSQRRVLLAGLVILLGVGLAAYALAPFFARARLAQQQRNQAAQVLSHVGDGVFLVDREGAIRFWNAAAEAITGLSARAVIGRPPYNVFRDWPEHPETQSLYEIDGRELRLSVSAVDSPIGIVYAFRDLSGEHRLDVTRSDFVATVSHELRTPLASIHGAAKTLREHDDRLPEARRRQLLDVVYEQSDRLAHLVDQILLANQIESGSVHVERSAFDAGETARRAVREAQPQLPPKVTLELLTDAVLPAAFGDPEQVRRVLLNLIENAVKYSPEGGKVNVVVTRTNGGVRFSVGDQGLGIPAHEQERIFEKFYRLDPGMSRGVGGPGLGLFVSRELVALMGGGEIVVSSRPGGGSTFSFELPVAEQAAA